MNATRDVFVVGLGAVSPNGTGRQAFWQALFAHPCAPDRNAIPVLSPDGRSLLHGYSAAGFVTDAGTRFETMGLHAIEEALRDTAERGIEIRNACVGFVIGTGAGDTESAEIRRFGKTTAEYGECSPYQSVDRMAEKISQPIDGPCLFVANACSSGLYGVAYATNLIREGLADAMIVLGIELLSRVTQAGFQKMTSLDPDRCIPFDARRNGTVLGEGAGALVLVSADILSPKNRERSYCRISGVGISCDAHHPTASHPDGRDIQIAMESALSEARIPAEKIDIVVPHGTGTKMNDRIEGNILAGLFRNQVSHPYILPIKAHIGHGAGASGVFSMIAGAICMEEHKAPPVHHIEYPDPAISLVFSNQPQIFDANRNIRTLVNAYGFGGSNISLVMEKTSLC